MPQRLADSIGDQILSGESSVVIRAGLLAAAPGAQYQLDFQDPKPVLVQAPTNDSLMEKLVCSTSARTGRMSDLPGQPVTKRAASEDQQTTDAAALLNVRGMACHVRQPISLTTLNVTTAYLRSVNRLPALKVVDIPLFPELVRIQHHEKYARFMMLG